MENQIATYLITQGSLGVAVLVLSVAVYKLWQKNQELSAQLVEVAQANGRELVEFYRQDAAMEAEKAKSITQMAHSVDMLTEKINRGTK